jgi:hypothetical protein
MRTYAWIGALVERTGVIRFGFSGQMSVARMPMDIGAQGEAGETISPILQ